MRDETEWQRTAQLASWLGSAWSKRYPSADKLLGKTKDAPLILSADDLRAHFKDNNAG